MYIYPLLFLPYKMPLLGSQLYGTRLEDKKFACYLLFFHGGNGRGRGCKIARLLSPSSYTTVTHIEKRSSMSASWKSSASFRLAVSGEPWAACRHRHAAGSVVPLLPGAVVGIRVLQRPLALIHPLLATTIMLCHRRVVLLCTAPMRVRSPSRPGRP